MCCAHSVKEWVSSLKLGKLPHQLGIVGQMRQLGMKKSQNKFLFSNLKTAGKIFPKASKLYIVQSLYMSTPLSWFLLRSLDYLLKEHLVVVWGATSSDLASDHLARLPGLGTLNLSQLWSSCGSGLPLWSHPAREPSGRWGLILPGRFPPIVIFSWSRVRVACCRGSHSNNKAATAPSIAFYCPLYCALCQLRFYCQEYCLPTPSSFKMEENGPVHVVFTCWEMRSIIASIFPLCY